MQESERLEQYIKEKDNKLREKNRFELNKYALNALNNLTGKQYSLDDNGKLYYSGMEVFGRSLAQDHYGTCFVDVLCINHFQLRRFFHKRYVKSVTSYYIYTTEDLLKILKMHQEAQKWMDEHPDKKIELTD